MRKHHVSHQQLLRAQNETYQSKTAVIMCFLWSPLALFRKLFGTNRPGLENTHREKMQPYVFGGVNGPAEETLVFFDLETTGLDTSGCDIVQLSAISGDHIFNAYILPRCYITEGASRVTGLTTNGQKLFLHRQPVDTVPVKEALKSFISFLKTFKKPILVGHNCKRFDLPVLLRILREFYVLDEFKRVVSCFLDTLILSRDMFLLPKYTQPYLVQHFLHKGYGAHNATEDVRALQDLFKNWKMDTGVVNRYTFIL